MSNTEVTSAPPISLPARLRYLAQFQGPPNDGAMLEAAAEIERLRLQVEGLWEQVADRDALAAELRRLLDVCHTTPNATGCCTSAAQSEAGKPANIAEL